MAILGPRQCGKTSLARTFEADHGFDLENPADVASLEAPQLTLEPLSGLIVIDEIQRQPDLFPLLRYLVDADPDKRFLILGSASRDLIAQSSETLAGRIGYHRLGGLGLQDVGCDRDMMQRLWLRGSFPRAFLAADDRGSQLWRQNYISTFLERDVPQLGIQIAAATLRRFWIMLSHYHGQLLNFAELGRSFGVSDMTVRRYIDVLQGTFMIRTLAPWHANLGKRLVRTPKLYLRDSGVFHSLRAIATRQELLSHPQLGASWEGFALEQVAAHLALADEQLFFWRTHGGAEVDLIWHDRATRWGAEFKYTDAPRLTKSMRIAIDDLELAHLWVVYPGARRYPLAAKTTALPLTQLATISANDAGAPRGR